MRKKCWFGILANLAAGILLAAPSARAQFEINPDHFDSPNMVPFDQSKTKANFEGAVANVHYEGRFILPYSVRCNGKNLHPGKYSIFLRADGKVGQARLNRNDETMDIAGVVQKQARRAGSNALVVELNRGTRKLSEIQIAQLDLILSSSDSKPERTERLLLTESTHKKVRPRPVPDSRNALSLGSPN
jgi:hypothetical protein